jgi:hypothetical protein
MNNVNFHNADVLVGETTSAVIPLEGDLLLAVSFPAGLDATAFTVLTSVDGVTYQTFYKDGADKSFTCAAQKNVDVSDAKIIAKACKIVLGTAQDPGLTLQATSLALG